MALFDRFKKNKAEEQSAEAAAEQKEASTLDLIKETMAEAQEEQTNAANDVMPTPEEIQRAQEVIARAQAANQPAPIQQGSVKAGSNAPVNIMSLKAVINAFKQAQTQENLKRIMDCLQNQKTLVTVPAKIITSKENEEKMKQGGNVKLEGPVHISPMIFTDNQGVKVFPLFSGEDAMPDDLKQKTSKVNMPFAQCVNIMKNIKDVNTFVLDPYTANIRIGVNQENKQ